NTVKVTVTGRVFGFEVVDIIDYPRWQNVFRLADGITWSGFTYKSGTNDKDGNCIFGAGVLPLLSGSNPGSITTEGSGLGYRVRFRLKTIGNFYGPDGAICIEPQFYYTTDGKTYKEVDLYYNEKIEGSEEYFVKVGGERDKRNLKYVTLGGDGKYSITTENERLLGKYVAYSLSGEWEDIYTKTPLYSYGKIRLGRSMRVYGGCESGEGFDIKTYRAQQIWYGEYCLPPRVYVLEKGTQKENGEILSSKITGLEDEFLKDGYIVVKFNITAKRNGLSDLLYENAENAANGYCNMWSVENFGLIRKDANENIWRFEYGDVLLFDTKNGIFKDYFSMGTH
nr:hypothetical protein [Eubacterium sp.]